MKISFVLLRGMRIGMVIKVRFVHKTKLKMIGIREM